MGVRGPQTPALKRLRFELIYEETVKNILCISSLLTASLLLTTHIYLNYFEGKKLRIMISKFGPHWHLQNLVSML